MSVLVVLFSAVLFFVLTPGVFVRFPKNSDKFTVAGVHAVIFALIFGLTHKFVWRLGANLRLEGFTEGVNSTRTKPSSQKPKPKTQAKNPIQKPNASV
jgi:hypothetical protein